MRTLPLAALALIAAFSWSIHLGAQQAPSHGQGLTGNLEHGKHLEHVAMCIECHSPRNENGDIITGREFLGASIPAKVNGWATFAPRNRGLLGYDDELAMRLLTQGAIGLDGRQLQRPMPRFRMTPEDAADVITFMRSMK